MPLCTGLKIELSPFTVNLHMQTAPIPASFCVVKILVHCYSPSALSTAHSALHGTWMSRVCLGKSSLLNLPQFLFFPVFHFYI